jgi:putative signal transducing protein
MDLVTVASFSLQPEAQLAKNLLESEEIPAVLSEEVAGDMLHLGSEIKLMVPKEFVDRARELLSEAEQHKFDREAAAEAEEHADDKPE